ncbi:MAG: glycosyltransferase family 2 protein [Phycisphaeraceae bacterium]
MTQATDQTIRNRSLFSIVLPAHNEREVLEQTHQRLADTADTLARDQQVDCEFVFVNDGSTDGTDRILDQMAAADPRVRVLHLTRNFGHQPAVCAGLAAVRGDVVAVMDADLQDPPEVLPRFLEKWREGYQVVYAIREHRKENALKRLAYWTFYRLLHAISEIDIPLDSGDFCVMDRSAVDLLNQLPERQRFVRGLRSWIGLKQIGVRYERSARLAGTPSYDLRRMMQLAADGLVSFSVVPLRLVTRLGVLCIALAGLIGLWVLGVSVYEMIYGGDTPRGWASLACLILLVASIQMVSLGIIGEYLARIFLEVKGRPTYLVGRVVDAESAPTTAPRDGAAPVQLGAEES